MATSIQDLVSMKSPYEMAIEAGGGLKTDTSERQKFLKQKAETDIDVAEKQAKISETYAEDLAARQAKAAGEKRSFDAFAPTPETGSDLAKLFAITTAMSFLGGGRGRYSGNAALTNLASAMDGYKKGRKDLFDQEMKAYDRNVKATIEHNKQIEEAYKDWIQARLARDKSQHEKLAVLQAYTGRQGALADIEKMSAEQANKALESMAKSRADWAKHVADMEAKQAHEAAAERRHRESLASQERLRLATIGEKKTAAADKALQSLGPALRNIAENYPENTVQSLLGASADDKKKVQGAYRAIEESEATADFIARNPGAVGAIAVLRNFVKMDAIKSIGKSEDEAAAAVQKSKAIDAAIDEAVNKKQITKDDAEAAKILQKRLFGLALADVQGSGQRGSVYLDRQFQNLYDQASRSDTLLKVIRERAEENNRNLKTYKLNVERHNNPENFPLLEARSIEEYVNQRAPAKQPTQKHIDILKADPSEKNKKFFDEKYGAGAADRILGGK